MALIWFSLSSLATNTAHSKSSSESMDIVLNSGPSGSITDCGGSPHMRRHGGHSSTARGRVVTRKAIIVSFLRGGSRTSAHASHFRNMWSSSSTMPGTPQYGHRGECLSFLRYA